MGKIAKFVKLGVSGNKTIIFQGCRLQKRFFEIHKVGIIGIFVLLKIENKGEIENSGIIFNSASLHKFKFVLEFIPLATVCNLFTS